MNLNASARIIREEALKRGYGVETFEDKHLLRISHKGKTFFTRGSRNSKQSSVGMTIADYKGLTRQILEKMGAPMAKGKVFFDRESGLEWARESGFPVVYKPSASRHGTGVVVGIKNEDELKKVLSISFDYRGYVLEHLLVGNDYRVLVVGNKVVATAQRLPAFVDGDGVSSIERLVEVENENPDRGEGHLANLTKIAIDDLSASYLEEQDLGSESVVEKGKRVFLKKTAGLSTGGVGVDVTGEVCTENIKLFERISFEADLSVVGVDVMAETLSTPLEKQEKAGILELNASPGLRMHHYPYLGKSVNAAGAILDLLFS